MNFQFYLERLKSSNVFKEFMKEHPDAYFCSGFFTIDKEGTDNQKHIDFYSPSKKKMFSFKIINGEDFEIENSSNETHNIEFKTPDKVSEKIDFSFDEVESLILKEMGKQKVENKLQKIMISLQNIDRKSMLLCTIFVSMFGLLKVQMEFKNKKPKIVLFERKSFFDLVKRVK